MATQLVIKNNDGGTYETIFKATFDETSGEEMRDMIDRLSEDGLSQESVNHEASVQVDTHYSATNYNSYGQVTHVG